MVSKIYPIASIQSRPVWNVFTALLFMLNESLNLFKSNLPSKIRVEINNRGIVISGGIYGREIPFTDIIKEEARVINLNIKRKYRPLIKKSGVEFPFYKEGWFILRNRERALVYLTDFAKAVYIPTKKGYSIILSLNEGEEFLRLLKKLT